MNKQRKRGLLFMPVVAFPFLCLLFYVLGGGGGNPVNASVQAMGLNPELPKAQFDRRQVLGNKLAFYEKAERDSAKRNEFRRMDPYSAPAMERPDSPAKDRGVKPELRIDGRANALLEQLGRMQASLQSPKAGNRPLTPPPVLTVQALKEAYPRVKEPVTSDPQVEQLNAMLDKVIRIQHPTERRVEAAPQVREEVVPADSAANVIAAVVAQRQTLTNGSTIALRLADSIRARGMVIPPGQLVYGVAAINGDRMQVRITAVVYERNLFPADWQIYDLDGLPGIHMSGEMGREIAKQSVDQGINSLNVLPVDPSVGAQAASAGVQAIQRFFSRKVRIVRVTVPAGYRVLLRRANMVSMGVGAGAMPETILIGEPPNVVFARSYRRRTRVEGVSIGLEGIYLKNDLLWIATGWTNRSAIDFLPEYVRWFIRDRRVLRRTAVQELALEPMSSRQLPPVGNDSVVQCWTAFRPFAPGSEKELVLEAGEKNGGRVLELVITNGDILKATKL